MIDWLKAKAPTKEALLANRWMRPFAEHLSDPNIWRFNRRSIARGVALGMFFGIIVPFGQALVAALFAVSFRANVAVAALCTFITNPFTTPLIYLGAYETGNWLLQVKDRAPILTGGSAGEMFDNLVATLLDAPLPTAIGLLLFSTVASAASYGLITLLWRTRVRQRWAKRRRVAAHG